MPKDFYFIRHGQSEANKAEIMCGGGVDTPLSEYGVKQVKETRDILKTTILPKKPDIIIHTGLKRTISTANIINEVLDLPIYEKSCLKEHVVGSWEGMEWSKVEKFFLDKQDPPGGETYYKFKERIGISFNDIINKFQTPLIVGHGGVFKVLMDIYGSTKPYLMDNAELYFLEHNKRNIGFSWNIHAVNDNFII